MKRPFAFKKIVCFNAIIALVIIFSLSTFGQHNQQFSNNVSANIKSGWTIKDPFKSEVFIENNGQFNNPDNQQLKNIHYGINNGELKVYFTPSGLSYHIINKELNSKYKNEIEEIKEEIERSYEKNRNLDDRLKKYYIDKSAYVNIEWLGANPNASIVVSDKVHDNYSYSVKNENGEYNSVIAYAYKKLTYKNIYSNIDVEYYFPENNDKLGVEYNIVVHPGGDLSKVKMKYSGMQKISLDDNGNIVVAIPDGNITDHAPGFSYVGDQGNEIQAKYVLQDQTVSFDVLSYDNTKKLVIDPFTSVWSISPGFTTTNNGYTIRVDYHHNVYVMGGANPKFQVKKFNSAGVLQWTAATPTGFASAYGDMTVLRDGKAIVGMGIGNGAQANILATSNGAITNKNCPGGVNEFGWRVYYNQTANDGVLWAGGGSNNGSHLIKTDTSLNAASIYNVWNSNTGNRNTEDISYLTTDPTNSFVFITNSSNTNNNGVSGSTSAPKFCKSAFGTPGTAIWQVNEPTLMMELGQGSFMGGGASTGVNGMATCGNSIYTYDGNNIRNYNSASGAIINSTTSGGAVDKYSGIDVDGCCRLYVGVKGIVKRYSSTLVFDQSITTTSDVYDLQLDPLDDNVLFVTGKGFVQRIDFQTCPTCINATKTNVSGCTLGSGTATVTDPSATAPLTYSWNNGGTTQTISGLTAGTYYVTVSDAATCPKLTWKDTIVVTGTFVPCGPTVTAVGNAVCPGACSTITATGANGTAPYSYNWNPGSGSGSSFSACPLSTTTYTVITTDKTGATASTTAVVTVNSAPTVNITGVLSICAGQSTTLTGTGGSTYSWNTGEVTTAITVSPVTTSTYTVSATTNGCTGSKTVTVTVAPLPIPTIVGNTTICAGTSTTLTATGGGSYLWNTGAVTSALTVSPGVNTSYTVIVTNGGCSGSASVSVTVASNLIPLITGTTSICNGGSTTLSTSGGGTYAWSDGTNNPSITVSPTIPTSYSVTVTNGSCSGTASVQVTVSPNPSPSITGNMTICNGISTTLTANAGGTYSWSSGQSTASITISPTNPSTSYTVIVTTGGCTGSATATVTANPAPVPTISGTTAICTGASTTLTSSTAGPYSWSPTGETTASITVTPNGTTTYVVSVTQNGCTGTVAQTVTVVPPITASITGKNICVGETVTLTATGGTNYKWNTGALTSSITEAPGAGVTTYTVVVSTGSCADTATYAVTVNPLPLALASGDTLINYGSSTPLKSSGGGTYEWIPPASLNCSNCQNPIATPSQTTQYCVIVTQLGCSDSACVTVRVDLKCGFEGELFVPNGFSPNDDGQNDVLYVRGAGITGMYWAIYDRWGEKVFETSNPKQGWDGTYKGKHLDPAVFVYYLEVTCVTGDQVKQKGNVAIVK